VSALLAVLAPGFQALAAALPAQAPNGRNIVGAQIAIGSMFSLHILIAGLVSGAAELGPAIVATTIASPTGWAASSPITSVSALRSRSC